MNYIGIDIGGTKCSVVLGDQNGNIFEKIKFPTMSVFETLKNIFDSVEKMGSAKAIGISCGGPLDSKNGIILSPPNLYGWDNIKIKELLENRFNIPVFLQNDANACAVAEWKFGAGIGFQNIVFLTFGTGIGAGIILNGSLYSGTNDFAGEIGHIRISENGPVGYGKSGSFEGFCSGNGIMQLGKTTALENLQKGTPCEFCKNYSDLDTINAKMLSDFANNGDINAITVYKKCGKMLGVGLSIIIDFLNPERIIIGSIFERSQNLLWDEAEKVIKFETLSAAYSVCKVVPALLGDKIGDLAAISVALSQERV